MYCKKTIWKLLEFDAIILGFSIRKNHDNPIGLMVKSFVKPFTIFLTTLSETIFTSTFKF